MFDITNLITRVAKLEPFSALEARAKEMLKTAKDEDVKNTLNDIIQAAQNKSSIAYLLWEDLEEMLDEITFLDNTMDDKWRHDTLPSR